MTVRTWWYQDDHSHHPLLAHSIRLLKSVQKKAPVLILGSHYLALIPAKCAHPIMSLSHAAPLPPQCWRGFVLQLAKPLAGDGMLQP